jgi:hypothetical protein
MKKPSKMKSKLSIILCALLLSCVPKPPDVPVCEDLKEQIMIDPVTGHMFETPSPTCKKQIGEASCGHCTYIVSGKEIYIGDSEVHRFNSKAWSQIRAESILVPAQESYAPIAAYMINSCKKMNCNNDVARFKVKFDSLHSIGCLSSEGQPMPCPTDANVNVGEKNASPRSNFD